MTTERSTRPRPEEDARLVAAVAGIVTSDHPQTQDPSHLEDTSASLSRARLLSSSPQSSQLVQTQAQSQAPAQTQAFSSNRKTHREHQQHHQSTNSAFLPVINSSTATFADSKPASQSSTTMKTSHQGSIPTTLDPNGHHHDLQPYDPYYEQKPPAVSKPKAQPLLNTHTHTNHPYSHPHNTNHLQSQSQPSPSTMMSELQAMGYSPRMCERALQISGYDLEQAVGFLLLGEASQRNLDGAVGGAVGVGGSDDGVGYSTARMRTTSSIATDGVATSSAVASAKSYYDDTSVAMGKPIATAKGSGSLSHQSMDDSLHFPTGVAVGRNIVTPDECLDTDFVNGKEDQLVQMGYARDDAQQALQIAHGDIQQAITFLCMGDSKMEFVTRDKPSSSVHPNAAASAVMGNITDHDAAVAAAIQERDFHNFFAAQRESIAIEQHNQIQSPSPVSSRSPTPRTVPQTASMFLKDPPVYSTEQTPTSQQNNSPSAVVTPTRNTPRAVVTNTHNSLPYLDGSTRPKPRMVSTHTSLALTEALPFCTCVCASKFLSGGVVSATFLHEIMESAMELYRKESPKGDGTSYSSSSFDVDQVLRKYGRSSHLRILAEVNGDVDPRHGVFMEHDLTHAMSIRRLLTGCRNDQGTGWQVLLVDLDNMCENGTGTTSDSFCVCLPPKGSTNKFWFFDFMGRSNVRSSGAYALVHSTLQHLEDSMVSVFKTLALRQGKDFISFTVYRIKKLS